MPVTDRANYYRHNSDNAFETTLANDITTASSTLDLTSISGWSVYDPYTTITSDMTDLLVDANHYTVLTISNTSDTVVEIVYIYGPVTGATGIPVERAVEGTTVQNWPAGTRVQARIMASSFDASVIFNGYNTYLQPLIADAHTSTDKILVSGFAVGKEDMLVAYTIDDIVSLASGGSTDSFKTIAISGQSNVVADSSTDTLTMVAGTGMTLTTNASTDTVTFATTAATESFKTISVSGQSDVVADSATDTLTLVAGSGVTLTTNASTDTITIAASGGGGSQTPWASDIDTAGYSLTNATTAGGVTVTTGNTLTLQGAPIALTSTSEVQVKGGTSTATGLAFYEGSSNGSAKVTVKAPNDITGSSYTLTLPQDDGSSGQVLSTDGSGVLSWASGGIPADGDYGDITVASTGTVWTIDTPASATIATDDKVLIKDTSASNVMKYVTTQAIADLSSTTKTATQNLIVGGNSTAAGYIDLLEDTDNGSNKVTITAPQSIASDKTITLQDVTGTVYVSSGTDVAVADGGTGLSSYSQGDVLYASGTTTIAALAKNTSSTRYLSNTGSSNNPAWAQIDLTDGVTGTLPVGSGGTGITSLGTGVATWLGTPSSANLRAALTDETGTGAAVFATSPTFTGNVNMGSNLINALTDPVSAQDAATKNYVDSIAAGLNPKEACNYASTINLTVTYSNGVSGVGATLTNAGTQAVFSLDGGSPTIGQRILIKDQTSGLQNGVYDVTDVGSVSTNWVLTRSADYNTIAAINNSGLLPVISGTVNTGTGWLETANIVAIGTTALVFVQFGQTAGIISVSNGGSGRGSATAYAPLVGGTTSTGAHQSTASGSAGQVLQSAGNAAVPTWSTPTYPSSSGTSGKFLISDGTNNVYTTSTIPTSAGATANKILLSDGTNYVLSTPTFPNASATSRKKIVSDGTNWTASTETWAVPGSSGNLLRSDGTNWTAAKATLTTDVTGVLPVANGGTNASSASITAFNNITGYTASGATGTTSTNLVFSTSPTLITPILGTPTSGTLTNCTGLPATTGITGTLPIANGGTNVTSVTTAPTASSFAGWDTNSNLSADMFLKGYTSTATAAGTTTLTVNSTENQFFTGSTTQTVVLPVVSTLALGTMFTIVNLSSGVVTVQSSGANSIQAMQANSTMIVISNATSGTNASVWYVIEYSAAASGQTGSGSTVRATSPSLVTPVLGTPSSGTLTSCTGLPISTGVSGLGSGVGTFLATPSSANLASAITDETGSGALVFATSPALTTPNIGTPSAGTLTSCTGLPLSTGVTGILPAANGGNAIIQPTGRLTLQSTVAVMTTTQSAKTTIYYTPYLGNTVPIYDGTNFINTTYTELSVATTDTTKSPAAIGASKVNDWFVWNDSGTIRLSHGPDWTNDTTRAAGTALTLVNGIYLNNASLTNGPAASRGTYVGTTRSNSSSQLDWIIGGAANDGSPASLFLWNMYNRVVAGGSITDTRGSHAYTTASWQAWNNTTGMRINYVVGLGEDCIDIAFTAHVSTTSNATQLGAGLGVDSTTAVSGYTGTTFFNTVNFNLVSSSSGYSGVPGIGVHYVSGLEFGGPNASQFGTSGAAVSGLVYKLFM